MAKSTGAASAAQGTTDPGAQGQDGTSDPKVEQELLESALTELQGAKGEIAELRGKLEQALKAGMTPDGRSAAEEASALKRHITSLEGEIATLRGKLEQAKAQVKDANAQVEQMKTRLQAASVSQLPELGEDAFELLESASVPQVGGGAGAAKVGDVVFFGSKSASEALQERLGTKARVFHVEKATVKELDQLGYIRVPAR